MKYFRDIPDEENATPARAMFLYKHKENISDITANIPKIFSATMLDLSLKGLIKFENANKREIRISLTENYKEKYDYLTEDEKLIFDIFKKAIDEKEYITPTAFSKFAKEKPGNVYKRLKRLDKMIFEYQKQNENISEEKLKISSKWSNKFVIYFILMFITIFLFIYFPVISIGFGMLATVCKKNSVAVSILTEKGYQESNQWKALKRYMEDYSMLDEKLIPDIVLWEKYLVYATVFGISNKLMKQLELIHPEMFEEEGDIPIHHDSRYWDTMTRRNNNKSDFDRLSRNLERVYTSARSTYNIAHSSSSSGSGGGGGFSSGGGSRWRRRKLRRTLDFMRLRRII